MIQVFVRVTSSYCSLLNLLLNLIFDAICLFNFEVIWVNTSQQVEHLDRHDMIHKKSQRQRRLYPRHAPKATIKTYMYDELLDKVQSSVEVSSQFVGSNGSQRAEGFRLSFSLGFFWVLQQPREWTYHRLWFILNQFAVDTTVKRVIV